MADVYICVFKAISILIISAFLSQKFRVEHLGMSYQEQNCIWFQPILTIEMRVTWENPRKIIFKVTSVNGSQS